MLHINDLLFDDWNEEHIARHHIEPEEVEEVCLGRPYVSRTREGKLRVIGQTDGGRYLIVILAPRGQGVYYPITARDATESERRLYKRKR
jgi:uncharacterized DUF497 family protein